MDISYSANDQQEAINNSLEQIYDKSYDVTFSQIGTVSAEKKKINRYNFSGAGNLVLKKESLEAHGYIKKVSHTIIKVVFFFPVLFITAEIAGFLTSGSLDPGRWNMLSMILYCLLIFWIYSISNKTISNKTNSISINYDRINKLKRNNEHFIFTIEDPNNKEEEITLSLYISPQNLADEFIHNLQQIHTINFD